MKKVVAYTDGSYNSTLGISGSGVYLVTPGAESAVASLYKTTKLTGDANSWNIVGEVVAAWMAIDWAIDNGYDEIEIKHDLVHIAHWFIGDWKSKSMIGNGFKEWAKAIIAEKKIVVTFTKVKAHSGVFGNDQADHLAKIGAKVISL